MKLQQLRELRHAKAKAAHDINDRFPVGGDRMPAAELEKLEAILAEIEKVDEDIEREQRLLKLATFSDDPQTQHQAAMNAATVVPGKHIGEKSESNALRAYLRDGVRGMDEEDRRAMLARQTLEIRNAMSTTTNTEGGYTTAPEYQKTLEVTMKQFGGILNVATIMDTATGMTMNFPTADPTAEIGEIVGQNAAVTALDTVFGNKTLDTYKYSSKKIALPFELIQDSFIDIEAYIQTILGMRLGRILSTHLTTGTGTGQPFGIVTGAASGKVGTTGQTLTVTYDDLVDLEHSVDPAYRGRGSYMMHDQSLKVLRKLKDTQGRPIFVPGYESGNPGGAPDRIMGRTIQISQEMPVMAANAKSILFGDFSKYIARRVMDLTLFRMTDSAFTLNGQVGFVAFNRWGGNLIDVGPAVKYYQNSAT